MQDKVDEFVAEFQRSLHANTLVKLVLSNYTGDDGHLQKISVREVGTNKGRRVAFQSRFDTRDEVKNFDFGSASELIMTYLRTGFRSAHLFTIENDFQLTIGKRSARLLKTKPTFDHVPSKAHDRKKRFFVDPNAYYLKALGVTTDNGRIRAGQRDKWKQINKFVEVLAGLIASSSLKDKQKLHIVDLGSGKGYLTFALYDHLVRNGNACDAVLSPGQKDIQLVGVEQRTELVSICSDIAQTSGFEGLRFVQGTIAKYDPGDVDILIALHACDTATDEALFKGIDANAAIIVAAPCCHHELKSQMKAPELLAGILKHPVMLERTAETLTDGIRSMLLEANGYKTKMFEFVAAEHTPKNNLLVATRLKRSIEPGMTNLRIKEIKKAFGIKSQKLSDLLDLNR